MAQVPREKATISESFTFSRPQDGRRWPKAVEGVDEKVLNPRETWADKEAYDTQAQNLVCMFVKNFDTFKDHVGADIMDASPQMALAAE